jgi:hypothetical protein
MSINFLGFFEFYRINPEFPRLVLDVTEERAPPQKPKEFEMLIPFEKESKRTPSQCYYYYCISYAET